MQSPIQPFLLIRLEMQEFNQSLMASILQSGFFDQHRLHGDVLVLALGGGGHGLDEVDDIHAFDHLAEHRI